MIISYADFRANVTLGDLQAIATLLSGDRIATSDPLQADSYQAIADRLYAPGVEVITKLTRSKERDGDGLEWHTFEARVSPVAVGYMAQLAAEGAVASQQPAPEPTPP